MEGRGRMESGGKYERPTTTKGGKKEVDRREGREEEGICRTNVKVLPTPLQVTLRSSETGYRRELYRQRLTL